MTATQKLQQIKNWLTSWNKQHSFARYTDANGKQFEVDGEFAQGKEMYQVQEDGMIKPAEDGEYHIDGRVLNVIEGLIAAVISGNRDLTEKQINPEVKQNKETMSEQTKMVSDALLDGTEIKISGDKVAAGADIRIVKDGQELMPPAGEMELKSGSVVIVGEDGKISEVKSDVEPASTDETKSETDEETEMSVPVEDNKGQINVETIHGMMKEMMEEIKSLKDKIGDVKDKQEKMKEDFSSFKKAPAAEPLTRNSKSKTNTTEYSFGSGEDPRVAMLELIKGHFKNK